MDRQDVLKRLLYPKCKTALEFKFDSLIVDPLLSYITVQDIAQLNKIATSLKYSSKPKEKYVMIDKIMTNRGFKKMASGTNRVTYRCLNDYRIVIKIAIDKVGLSDNGNEYRNQQLLKPFVTKCFEVSPCGTVGLFERVVPITSREEFVNISDDIFDLINNLIGKFVLEDIGEKFYMNYGLREGFGPVLLDYPYVFELDGRKLICSVPEPFEPKGYCGGEIDYDLGYNDLICKKCGKRYLATELKSDEKSDKPKIIIEGDDCIMKCVIKRGDEIVANLNNGLPIATNTIKPRKDFLNLKAQITSVEEKKEEQKFTHEIKTRDEVQLQVRVRGNRTSKDIDKEAREKEAKIDMRTEKVKVDFTLPLQEEPVEDKPQISVKLSTNDVDVTHILPVPDVIVENLDLQVKKNSYSLTGAKKFNAIITYNGEIWDTDTNKLIGYSVEETKFRNSKIQESEAVEESNDLVYSDPDEKITIGDIISSKNNTKGNYKTNDIVAHIEPYFSATDTSEDEETVEEEKEVPELIIHPRDNENDIMSQF